MKILVVEDEPIIRLGIAATIEDAGYEVLEAANADEAVTRLAAEDDVRVVITDVDMPGSMNGIQLAHYARGRWPDIGLLVISGQVGVTAGQLPGGARFMSKPYQEPRLLKCIAAMTATTTAGENGA
jgi:CheY-like chemotaxis protein